MTTSRYMAGDPELPVGSVMLDGCGHAWQQTSKGEWHQAGDEYGIDLAFILSEFGPVTIIYEASEGQQ